MTLGDEAQRLAVLTHEVRSPVAALSAIADNFPDAGLERAARLELARLAIAACRGIERVVIDAAMASIHLEQVDVCTIAQQAAAAATLGGELVQTDVPTDAPRIAADPVRLRQALDNLIANALTHAGPDPGIVVKVAFDETWLELSVQDSGVGVPLVEQKRIFEPGVRLDTQRAGSGLGLAVARGIVEAHGGELLLHSNPGEGATFALLLPLDQPATAASSR